MPLGYGDLQGPLQLSPDLEVAGEEGLIHISRW